MNTATDQIKKLNITTRKQLLPQVKELRYNVQKSVGTWFNCSGFSCTGLANILDVDKGGLHKELNNTTPFTLPFHALVRLNYDLMFQSCHQMFFGEPHATTLPKTLSALIILIAQNIQNINIEKLIAFTRLKTLDCRKNGTILENNNNLLAFRFSEFLNDNFLGSSSVLSVYHNEKYGSIKKSQKNPGRKNFLNFAIMLAMYCDTSLDYFIAAACKTDYRLFPEDREYAYTHIKSMNGMINGEGTIKSVDLERFIQLYMTLPTEARISVDTEILKKIYFNE